MEDSFWRCGNATMDVWLISDYLVLEFLKNLVLWIFMKNWVSVLSYKLHYRESICNIEICVNTNELFATFATTLDVGSNFSSFPKCQADLNLTSKI